MISYSFFVLKGLISASLPNCIRPYASLFSSLKPGDVCIDCGANAGVISKLMLNNGARVYAFEPDPAAYKALKEKFGNNPNATLYEKAVWTEERQMKLFFHRERTRNPLATSIASSLFEDKENVDKGCSQVVQAINLIEFVRALGSRVKIMKMDVEGAEYALLDGIISSGLLSHKIDHILVETHANKIPSLRSADASLRNRIKRLGLQGQIKLGWL